jgi:hypothetical protein
MNILGRSASTLALSVQSGLLYLFRRRIFFCICQVFFESSFFYFNFDYVVRKDNFYNPFNVKSCTQVFQCPLVGWWVGFGCGWVKLNVLQKRWFVFRLAALLILRSVGILSSVFFDCLLLVMSFSTLAPNLLISLIKSDLYYQKVLYKPDSY